MEGGRSNRIVHFSHWSGTRTDGTAVPWHPPNNKTIAFQMAHPGLWQRRHWSGWQGNVFHMYMSIPGSISSNLFTPYWYFVFPGAFFTCWFSRHAVAAATAFLVRPKFPFDSILFMFRNDGQSFLKSTCTWIRTFKNDPVTRPFFFLLISLLMIDSERSGWVLTDLVLLFFFLFNEFTSNFYHHRHLSPS